MTPRCFALIPAAGVGARAGGAIAKQYLPVAGEPMIVHTLRAFGEVTEIVGIVVVVAPNDDRFHAIALEPSVADRVTVVHAGGATRDATVANGLAALQDVARDDDWVLVHDAARCGITASTIERLIERLRDDPVGGLLALPLDDTIKREIDDDRGATDSGPVVAQTVDRRGLWRAQTPQMVRYGILCAALADARARGVLLTDEASALEAAGHRVLLVPGAPDNFKVTTAADLAMMDVLLQGRLNDGRTR